MEKRQEAKQIVRTMRVTLENVVLGFGTSYCYFRTKMKKKCGSLTPPGSELEKLINHAGKSIHIFGRKKLMKIIFFTPTCY